MDLFEAISTQRAIRRLKPDPLPDTTIRRLLEAAICAPSGGNRQPWRFVVIRDAALRAQVGALYRECFTHLLTMPFYRDAAQAPPETPAARVLASSRHLAEHMGEAPVLILACLDAHDISPGVTMGASIYPAVQNLLLAARALGLGTTLTTIHRFQDARLKSLLGIPDGIETAALIPVGYPLRKFGRPPRKPIEDVAYADRWGAAGAW